MSEREKYTAQRRFRKIKGAITGPAFKQQEGKYGVCNSPRYCGQSQWKDLQCKAKILKSIGCFTGIHSSACKVWGEEVN